jgi:hypothetical protein
MKRKILMLAIAAAFAGGTAGAEVSTQSIIDGFTAQGFTAIEIKRGPSQIKVEARNGATEVEVIYDRETGAVLKQEQHQTRAGEDMHNGVSVRDRNEDFLDDDDDEDDDDRSGRDDDDEDDDDHSGRDDDHDDDDHGGHGSDDDDDDGDDDHGGSGSGSDDDGDDD